MKSETRLFWMKTSSASPSGEFLDLLDEMELARLSEITHATERHGFIMAHGLLHLSGIMAHDDIHVSLSHAAGMVAVAASGVGPVGIDVEPVVQGDLYDNIPVNFFAASEIAWLQEETSGSQSWNRKFTELWCMKEAVLKATGQGFSVDSRSFALSPDTLSMLARGPDGSNPEEWCFHLEKIDEWQLALAIRMEKMQEVDVVIEEISPPNPAFL